MQVNEFAGKVWQGTRPPDVDRKFKKTRRTVTRLSEGTWQNSDGREAVAGTTDKPRLYGAGF